MVKETDIAYGSLASRRHRQVNRQLQYGVISAVLGKSPGVMKRRRTQSGPNPFSMGRRNPRKRDVKLTLKANVGIR